MAFCAPEILAQNTDVQTYPRIEFFAGYSAIETNNHTFLFSEVRPVSGLDYDEQGNRNRISLNLWLTS
jgi:hypothetical protein